MARERERERESVQRGCLQQGLAITLHRLVFHETRVFSAYFFVYEGLVHDLLMLGPINILCRSGECKPIFCFSGDLN